jgi:hypothetical protein
MSIAYSGSTATSASSASARLPGRSTRATSEAHISSATAASTATPKTAIPTTAGR